MRTEDYRVTAVGGPADGCGLQLEWERSMEIRFRHDVDNVFKEAKEQKKPVLLDFSAAPM